MTVTVTDRTIPGPHGEVPVRSYLGAAPVDPNRAGLVWVHGGGFAGGSLDMPEADWVAQQLAEKVATLPWEASFPPEITLAMNLNYVGDEAQLANPYAFPGGHDPQGLPPTFILNSDHDRLRSSGEAYASELAAAGVDVLVLRENGTRHGHLNEPDNPAAPVSIERMSAWLHPNPLQPSRRETS